MKNSEPALANKNIIQYTYIAWRENLNKMNFKRSHKPLKK